jgi:hypothetical protein
MHVQWVPHLVELHLFSFGKIQTLELHLFWDGGSRRMKEKIEDTRL